MLGLTTQALLTESISRAVSSYMQLLMTGCSFTMQLVTQSGPVIRVLLACDDQVLQSEFQMQAIPMAGCFKP